MFIFVCKKTQMMSHINVIDRFRVPKKLSEKDVNYAKQYAKTQNSWDSYIESHRHVIKVKASNPLRSLTIWGVVFSEWEQSEQSEFQKSLFEIKQSIEGKYKISIFDLTNYFIEWTDEPVGDINVIDRDQIMSCVNNDSDDEEIEHFEPSPVSCCTIIFQLYKFWSFLRRDYFCSRLITIGLINQIKYMNEINRGGFKDDVDEIVKYAKMKISEDHFDLFEDELEKLN